MIVVELKFNYILDQETIILNDSHNKKTENWWEKRLWFREGCFFSQRRALFPARLCLGKKAVASYLLRLHQHCFPRKMLSSPPACLSASPQALLSLLKMQIMQIMHPSTAHNNREFFLAKKDWWSNQSLFLLLQIPSPFPRKIENGLLQGLFHMGHIMALNWKWTAFCKQYKQKC